MRVMCYILYKRKNIQRIYKEYLWNMQLQTTSPESKFPNEYTDLISFKSINIWKSHCKNTKRSRFYESRCTLRLICMKKIVASVSMLAVDFIFFIDEKIFTVAPPVNIQNDCMYVAETIMMWRRLRTRLTFSNSLMVSTAVSKLGCSSLVFVGPGMEINGS